MALLLYSLLMNKEEYTMNRTSSYQFTVDMIGGQPVQWEEVNALRTRVRAYNTATGKRLYVKLQGRLGENNPHGKVYRKGPARRYSHQCIRLNHAQRADVYVYER